MTRSPLPGLAIATAVLIAGLLLAFTVGRYPVSLHDLAAVLLAKLSGAPSGVWVRNCPSHPDAGVESNCHMRCPLAASKAA